MVDRQQVGQLHLRRIVQIKPVGYVNPSGVRSASELRRGRESASSDPGGGRLSLIVSLLYLLFRRALAVAALRLRSREFK